MKKIFVVLSMVAFLVACDDSASAGNNEPTTLSSAEEQGCSSSVMSGGDKYSLSSSSEKNAESSSSEKLSGASSSSAGKVASSSSDAKKTVWNYLNPDIDYDEFIDKRDGQVYKTVQIGDQVWMVENLNYQTENSWCGGGHEYTEGDCSVYGRLYTWAAAMGKSEDECGHDNKCNLGTGKVQGVCPDGWHVPTPSEWKDLFAAVGGPSTAGAKLKATILWNAEEDVANEDTYGFAALPAGYNYRSDNDDSGYFRDVGYGAYFWSDTEEPNRRNAYYMFLYYNIDHASYLSYDDKICEFSVRCLKD